MVFLYIAFILREKRGKTQENSDNFFFMCNKCSREKEKIILQINEKAKEGNRIIRRGFETCRKIKENAESNNEKNQISSRKRKFVKNFLCFEFYKR